MNYVAPPQEKALPLPQEKQRQSLSIKPSRNPSFREGSNTVSAAVEARDVERAEQVAAAALNRLGADLRMMADGGYLVCTARVRRRCSDMHAVHQVISALHASRVAAS